MRSIVGIGLAAACDLPVSLKRARNVISDPVWSSMVDFFCDEGKFKIRIDTRCSQGHSRLRPKHLDGRWSLDLLLPQMVAQSEWAADDGNVSLVIFDGRRSPRTALSECARRVSEWSWFTVSTDRGRCCDGGQLRDPYLLKFHFLTTAGEHSRGRFLFREKHKGHLWRAPVTRDTAPRLKCFDDANDVVLPPPAYLRSGDDFQDENNRTVLVMHAEGGAAPPEYELRRLLTTSWARDWWRGAFYNDEIDRIEKRTGLAMEIRKVMTRATHAELMRTSRYCLVVEGYAPWTPRLVEAIRFGCVPAILSPSYLPPFSDILDWSKFSIRLHPSDIPSLPQKLLAHDYAELKRNLDDVKSLFSFCLPGANGRRLCDDDGLPLIIYQMAQRHHQRQREDDSVFALTADERNNAHDDPSLSARTPRRTRVDFLCHDQGSSCQYRFDHQHWQCDAATPMACSCTRLLS